MKDARGVVARAEKLVTPTDRERRELERTTAKLLARVGAASAAFEGIKGVLVGGSFAKGTWLPRDVDIDIFVKITPSVDKEEFESIGLGVGRRAARGLPHGKKYAQHPYTEAIVGGVKVNIVPCYDVKPGQWRSAADRSPYHVEFVMKSLGASKKGQVRLLKRFMKVVGVYGAEIEKEGFSGYATEVLVYLHGGFLETLRYFATLKAHDGGRFLLSDPIDENRELSRAISPGNVARMTLASRAFLDRPDPRFFTHIDPLVRGEMRDRLYAVVFDHPKLSEDTLWGELKRSTRQVEKYIEGYGFTISRSVACSNSVDRSAIVLLPETERLSDLEERIGPGAELADEVSRFVAKNRKKAELIWVADDGRIHVMQKRETKDLAVLMSDLRGRISKVGASREVADAIRRNGTVLHGGKLREALRREEWLSKGVEQVISDTIGTDTPR